MYAIFDLLYLDGHSLIELPYRERRERLEALNLSGTGLARARRPPRRGQAAARGHRQAGPRGDRGQAPGLPLRARPAQRQLAEDQAHPAPGARDRRLDPGRGPAHRADRGAAHGLLRGRRVRLRRAGRHRLHREDARRSSGERLEPLRRDTSPFDRAPEAARARRCSSSRSWWPRSSCASGRPSGSCARRRSRACARTSRRARCGSRSSARTRPSAPDGSELDPSSPEALFDEVERLPEGALLVITEGRELKITNWDKVLYPQTGFTKGDLVALLRARRTARAPAPARPAADAQALPERRRPAVLLREAVALAPPRVGPDRADRRHQLHARPGPAHADLAGQPGRRRAAHLAVAGRPDPSGRR